MATIIVSDWNSFITAVGTSGADVEFPKNLIRTRDRDVDPNKLYVDVNGIVQTNVQPEQLPNLYENTFVLDANLDNELKTGFTETITVNCNSINGYGGCIKNLYSNSVALFTFVGQSEVKNISFLNFNLITYPLFSFSSTALQIKYCLFSGQFTSNNNILFYGSNYIEFTSCSFYIVFKGNDCNFDSNSGTYGAIFNYCRIEFDCSDTTGTNNIYNMPVNSYFTGNFKNCNLRNTGGRSARYSIYEITGNPLTTGSGSNPPTLLLINTDLYTHPLGIGFVGVSSEDLTDAETLRVTYGFPIQT